jgi:predicted PurR-regulated permease PerM
MKQSEMKTIEDYFEVFLILSLTILFFYILKPFITPLLFAAILVFLLYKPYLKLVKLTDNKSLSALFMLFMVVIVLTYPIFWLTSSLIGESSDLINSGKNLLENAEFSNCDGVMVCELISDNLEFIALSVTSLSVKLNSYFLGSIELIFTSFTSFLIGFIIFLVGIFFFLRDGDKFVKYIKKIIPMKNSYKNSLFLKFKDVLIAIFYNTLFLAILQGMLVGLAFWVIGIPSPVFWSIVASLCALLPLFGPAIVWLPAVIYLFIIGDYSYAIGLFLYGLLLVGLIDNMIRPFLLNKKLEVHEFLVLLSVLGGIQVFGFFLGLFLGPMIISFLVAVLHLYHLDFK